MIYFSKSTAGFYSPEIHGKKIPEDAVEISDDLHRELIDGQSDGGRIAVDKKGNPYLIPRDDPTIEDLKQAAKIRVDSDAEIARMKFITRGEGQAWTYQRKEAEAERVLEDQNPDPADYPVLFATIPADGATLAEVAERVIAARDEWLVIGAAIEGLRRNANVQIGHAVDAAEIEVVTSSIQWPAP